MILKRKSPVRCQQQMLTWVTKDRDQPSRPARAVRPTLRSGGATGLRRGMWSGALMGCNVVAAATPLPLLCFCWCAASFAGPPTHPPVL